MCSPTMALSAGLSGAGMLANRSAQNAATAASQKAIDEQTKLSREQFDERTRVIKDSDARIRELEATGFDRSDAAKQVYIERVGDILENEARRTGQMRAEQSALVDTAIGASDFDTFSGNAAGFAQALDALTGGGDATTQDMPAGMSAGVRKEVQRREAEMVAQTMGREAAANRLLATNFAIDRMGDALGDLRIGSGITSAKFAAGNTLPGQMRSADLEAGAIEPELGYIDKMTGIKSARTEGAVGASRQFEGSMASLAQQRAAALQASPNTNIGDMLGLAGGAVGSFAANGGKVTDWFGAKPTPVKPPIQIAAGTFRRPTFTPYSTSAVGGIY